MTESTQHRINTDTMAPLFEQMLALQEEMNQKVHPQWRDQHFAWYRAMWVETAEMLDHFGWKWWKQQTPDWGQVHLELVDIWHFGLSYLLQDTASPNDKKAVAAIAASLASTCDALSRQAETADHPPAANQADLIRESIETFASQTLSTHGFDADAFFSLMLRAEFSLPQLFSHYVGKNVLNMFRQDHGYQSGSYIKQWHGREDNEHLTELLAQFTLTEPDIRQRLYSELNARYPRLCSQLCSQLCS